MKWGTKHLTFCWQLVKNSGLRKVKCRTDSSLETPWWKKNTTLIVRPNYIDLNCTVQNAANVTILKCCRFRDCFVKRRPWQQFFFQIASWGSATPEFDKRLQTGASLTCIAGLCLSKSALHGIPGLNQRISWFLSQLLIYARTSLHWRMAGSLDITTPKPQECPFFTFLYRVANNWQGSFCSIQQWYSYVL